MANYYTSTTFSLLVLVLVTSTGPRTTVADYCGPTKTTDPDFPGHVDTALNKVIENLVSENAIETSLTYPEPVKGQDSVYASASCLLGECQGCMDYLLPYVSQCSEYTTGAAYVNGGQCGLRFELTSWTG